MRIELGLFLNIEREPKETRESDIASTATERLSEYEESGVESRRVGFRAGGAR